MRIYLILLLSCYCLIANAQQLPEEEAVIRSIINNQVSDHKRPVCSNDAQLSNTLIQNAIAFVNHDTSVLGKDLNEKKDLIARLENANKAPKWKGTIADIPVVPGDSIRNILSDLNKDWPYFAKKYGSSIYAFSRPVFNSAKTVCFVYVHSTSSYLNNGKSPSGDYDVRFRSEFWVYVKLNNKWVKKERLYSVVS